MISIIRLAIIRLIILCFFISTLMACSYLKDKFETSDSKVEIINWQKLQAECDNTTIANKTCPSFKFNGLSFKNKTTLNNLIERDLLTLVNAPDDISLWDYQRNYLASANNGDHLQFSAKILEENDSLIILKLTAQASHSRNLYSPIKTTFINFDKQTKQDIKLSDVIYPDKIQTFWTTVQVAYNQWLEFNQLLNNKVFQQDWPFIKTSHMILSSKGLVLKYESNTLAPYAMGEPTLVIPYNNLEGIIKPEYIPD